MNVSSIGIQSAYSGVKTQNSRPSFKAKLMLDPRYIEEKDFSADKTDNKKTMYLFQKAIQKFMAKPEDLVEIMEM